MRDFAIGILFSSAMWLGVTTAIAHKAARRNEALSRYNGALEERIRRVMAIYDGLSGRELTVIKGGRD